MVELQTEIKSLNFSNHANLSVSSQNSRLRFSIQVGIIPEESLWWPAGYGKQPLYDLTLTLSIPGVVQTVQREKRIGFRLVELIQKPVNSNKDHGLTFYFSINKQPIFLKG